MLFQHVTSTVSVLANDGIVVHVLNHSPLERHIRVQVFMNTGAGAKQMFDSGAITVTPMWAWGLAHNVVDSGEYWIAINADDDVLVPKVSFERNIAGTWTPFVSYSPGDFAVFKDQRRVR